MGGWVNGLPTLWWLSTFLYVETDSSSTPHPPTHPIQVLDLYKRRGAATAMLRHFEETEQEQDVWNEGGR